MHLINKMTDSNIMNDVYLISIVLIIAFVLIAIFIAKKFFNENAVAQRQLNDYLQRSLSSNEIGTFYERYVGYLYESEGYEVIYNGAINGFTDMGRDLIVKCIDEVLIIQVKCWGKMKVIHEKYIFQLFGSMTHFKLTEKLRQPVVAVFYTTAQYSAIAQNAANILGVELVSKELDRSYPMIKCSTSKNGDKFYYLPFDIDYDKIRVNVHREEYFVSTVKEAVQKGFKRAPNLVL